MSCTELNRSEPLCGRWNGLPAGPCEGLCCTGNVGHQFCILCLLFPKHTLPRLFEVGMIPYRPSVILWPEPSSLWKVPECFPVPPTCPWTEQVWSRANGFNLLQAEGDPNFPSCVRHAPAWRLSLQSLGAACSLEWVSGQQRQAVGKVLLVPRNCAVTSDIPCAPSSYTWDQHHFLHWFCRQCNPSSEVCCQQGFRGRWVGFSHCCIYS